MLKALLLVVLVGCAGPRWSHDLDVDVSFAVTSAMIACDVSATAWGLNYGRCDRATPDRRLVIHEGNPVLGECPSMPVLAGAAAGVVVVNYGVARAPVPRWLRHAWLAVVGVIEAAALTEWAPTAGVCGLAGTRDGGTGGPRPWRPSARSR